MDTQKLWEVVLADLQLQVTKVVFQTLLSQTILVSFDGTTATVAVQNPLLINLIEGRYLPLIKQTLDNYTKADTKIVFTAKNPAGKRGVEGPLFTLKHLSQNVSGPHIKLNPDYTFTNFAVSSSNQMAYAAATAVAKSPGSSYSPLFIYGGVGIGKTHLMQAIGHFVLSQKPNTKILYCTGEEFTNEIIEAIGNKTTTPFKKKYRQVGLLLLDDIQFIAGKYSIQEEFFHTFNAIHQYNGQIVLTSDRPPEVIEKLEERLKSRFEGGLTIDIGQPDYELRTAILLIKSKQRNINLPMEVASLIASSIENPRKLEGILIRLNTEAQTKGVDLDLNLAQQVLGKTLKEAPKKERVSPETVINKVASFYNLKISQLKGSKRDQFLVVPRQILYYLLKVEIGVSLMQIGNILGGRDHTTILYGVRKITHLVSTDEKIRGDILGIKNQLFG